MVFYTSQGRSFGPYGKCGKGHQTQYTRFRDEYSKRHVRLDKLKDQVQLTANKYAGNKYVKLFKKMGKFYDQDPIFTITDLRCPITIKQYGIVDTQIRPGIPGYTRKVFGQEINTHDFFFLNDLFRQ